MTHVWRWQVAESRLSAADDGPEHVGRWWINIGSDGRRQEMQEHNGWRQEWQKRADAFRRRWKMAVRHTTIAFSEGRWSSCISTALAETADSTVLGCIRDEIADYQKLQVCILV